jgi:hypothetical protein
VEGREGVAVAWSMERIRDLTHHLRSAQEYISVDVPYSSPLSTDEALVGPGAIRRVRFERLTLFKTS